MTRLMAVWFGLLLVQPGTATQPEQITLSGRVVELAPELQRKGLVVDAERVAQQVVLKSDDGTLTPLLSDDASRALFLDMRLQNRRTEIHARRFAEFPYLQVVSFKVEENGKLRTPEYYCDVCTISVRYPQACPCCQGVMELRMKPEAP
jgi:hypothetical protein